MCDNLVVLCACDSVHMWLLYELDIQYTVCIYIYVYIYIYIYPGIYINVLNSIFIVNCLICTCTFV